MKKFKFRLASVLDVRKKREQDALVGLAAAQKAYQDAVSRKNQLQQDLVRSFERRQELAEVGSPAFGFQLEQDFIHGTKRRILQAEQNIVRATRGVEKALRVFLFARKQTRMIEVLEEKERREYRRLASVYEQKKLDEIVTMRARLVQER
jgi:flagellar export protein FliJ